jgi:hypothetical protein
MQSILHILKINEPIRGKSKSTGKDYEIHTAECAILDEVGHIEQVGVLDIPRDLREKLSPGVFMGQFALAAAFDTRKIQSRLVGLLPYDVAKAKANASAPKAA